MIIKIIGGILALLGVAAGAVYKFFSSVDDMMQVQKEFEE